jgi:hypothetical protein
MEETEYNKRLKKIEADYEASKKALHIEFGLSNPKYKKGDIIKSSSVTILIDKITVYKAFGLPEPVYHGVVLKKDLTPNKRGTRDSIYGSHLSELIKV